MDRSGSAAGLAAWEAEMASAARAYARRLVDPGVPGHRELRATLWRLGFAPADIEAALADPKTLDPAVLRAMTEPMRSELERCKRQARAARADYDLNRHIVLFRALRQLEGPASPGVSPRAGESRADNASRSAATASRVSASMRR